MTSPSDADTFCASQVGAGFRCVRITDLDADVEGAEDVAFCVGPEWLQSPIGMRRDEPPSLPIAWRKATGGTTQGRCPRRTR